MTDQSFTPGQRVRDMDGRTGEVLGVDHVPAYKHGVTGEPMPAEIWVEYLLDDGGLRLQIDGRKLTVLA
jgi:hypothetical protein